MLTHLAMRSPEFPFVPDSASYIEQARSHFEKGSALERSYSMDGGDKEPSKLFPIGFPATLALFEFVGVDASKASIAVNWLSSSLLPILFFLSFRGALGESYAAIVAALSVFSPGIVTYSGMGATDIFSLAFTACSIALVINTTSGRHLAAAGIFAGIAYSIRNAHLALLLSSGLYFFSLSILDKKNQHATAVHASIFLSGALLILLPVLARNLILFGSLNPYQMEPSTIGLAVNIRTFIQEFLYDITANRHFARALAWSFTGLISLGVSSLFLGWTAVSSWTRLDSKQKNLLLFGSIYSLVGACIVITARTRYQWGEPINVRHTLQYAPYFLAASFVLVSLRTKIAPRPTVRYLLMLAVAAITVLHGAYAINLDA